MSDPKRVTFETIPSGNWKNSTTDAPEKNEKTVRLVLNLSEPTVNWFPQFNFKKLCRAEKVKKK